MISELREAAEAAELLERRARTDGLYQARFFPHQVAFAASKKPEVWLFGANRSGKTEIAMAMAASFARYNILDPVEAQSAVRTGKLPKFYPVRIWVISRTTEMSRNIVQAKLFDNGARIDPRPPFLPEWEKESWNITTQTYRLKNGSIVLFKTGEAGRDVFMAADVDLIVYDEVPPEEVYIESAFRIGSGRKLLIRGAATILPPPGVTGGISWMYRQKVQPWQALGKTPAECNALSPDLDIFTAGMRANPTILPEEIARLGSILPSDSPEYLIRVEGHLLPSIGGSLCYPRFSRVYHTVPRMAVIPQLPLSLCVDFNPEHGVWAIGQRVGHVFRVIDEITMEQSNVLNMVQEFRLRYPAHGAELWIYGDSTGRKKETQTGLSTYHLIANYMTGYPVPIRHKIPDQNPGERDRIDAVNLQISPPTGERMFLVSSHCEETIKDLEGTTYNTRMKIDKRGGRRSDAMDAIGYWICFEAPAHNPFVTQQTVRSIRGPSYWNQNPSINPNGSSALKRFVKIGRLHYGR